MTSFKKCIVMIFIFVAYSFYFWLRWMFVAARGLSLVAASGGCSSLPCEASSNLLLDCCNLLLDT